MIEKLMTLIAAATLGVYSTNLNVVVPSSFNWSNPSSISIEGPIDESSLDSFTQQLFELHPFNNQILIKINSPGGVVYFGQQIIDEIQKLQKSGIVVGCLADGQFSSMAFNIMSFCSIRAATKRSFAVVHKIAVMGICGYFGPRCTSKYLESIVKDMIRDDEPYRVKNSIMMNLSLSEYDILADAETMWTTEELLSIGYLNISL